MHSRTSHWAEDTCSSTAPSSSPRGGGAQTQGQLPRHLSQDLTAQDLPPGWPPSPSSAWLVFHKHLKPLASKSDWLPARTSQHSLSPEQPYTGSRKRGQRKQDEPPWSRAISGRFCSRLAGEPPAPPAPTWARCILGAGENCCRPLRFTAQASGTAQPGWQLLHVCLDPDVIVTAAAHPPPAHPSPSLPACLLPPLHPFCWVPLSLSCAHAHARAHTHTLSLSHVSLAYFCSPLPGSLSAWCPVLACQPIPLSCPVAGSLCLPCYVPLSLTHTLCSFLFSVSGKGGG